MTGIDPSHRLDALLREQLARLRERGRAAKPGEAAVRQRDTQSTQVLATRIAALDPADPDRMQKAVRLFLESELAREFGTAILNDPGFSGMLDAIQAQMNDDAQLAAATAALGELLVTGRIDRDTQR